MPTFDSAYFEALYRDNADPWCFRSSLYERAKYDATLAALDGKHFDCCLELGCSIGVFTAQLLTCCRSVVAVDTSEEALRIAQEYCPSPCADFRLCHLPCEVDRARFDLVIASEILYYFDRSQLSLLAYQLKRAARPGALLVAVHWTGPTDYPLSEDEAVSRFFKEAALISLRSERTTAYRLDVGQFSE